MIKSKKHTPREQAINNLRDRSKYKKRLIEILGVVGADDAKHLLDSNETNEFIEDTISNLERHKKAEDERIAAGIEKVEEASQEEIDAYALSILEGIQTPEEAAKEHFDILKTLTQQPNKPKTEQELVELAKGDDAK